MKVLCYVQPHRGGGVARHSVEMIGGLLRRAGFTGALLASGPDLRRHASFARQVSGIPIQRHPLPGKWIERSWKAAGWPSLGRRCHGFDAIYSPAEVRLPGCGIPSIITIHDVQALETDLPWSQTAAHRAFRSKWLRWLPTLFAEATRIATVSEFSKQRMVTLLGVAPSRISVIGNGVSTAFFRPETSAAHSPKPSIVVIGGLRMKKGAAETLAVAEELRRRGSNLGIDVYGQHDSDWVERAAQHSNVRLHGYEDDSVLASRLGESTALLFLSPYEGFGIPAVEAMAAGTPAVVSDAASLPEVVGSAGIVVNAKDSAVIADILEHLSHDMVFRRRQVEAGRQRALQFTWESCVDRLAEAMHEVAS